MCILCYLVNYVENILLTTARNIYAKSFFFNTQLVVYVPNREKTGFLPLQKQRRRSANCKADQHHHFHYMYSTISLFLKSKISSF